jgi:hypothetical protein
MLFKPGDKVVCIDPTHGLRKGRVYIVDFVVNNYVYLVDNYSSYYLYRFKKAIKSEHTVYAVKLPGYYGFASGYVNVTKMGRDASHDQYKVAKQLKAATLFINPADAKCWLNGQPLRGRAYELVEIKRKMYA